MEAFDSISSLYEQLKEEDLWGGLWQKRSKYQETAQAVALEQQGLFNTALATYERAFTVHLSEIGGGTSPQSMNVENELQWNHYLRYGIYIKNIVLDYYCCYYISKIIRWSQLVY